MEIIKNLPEIFDEFEDKKKQSFLKTFRCMYIGRR